MDRITEHHPHFAEALRSLTVTTAPQPMPMPGKPARRWPLPATGLIGSAAGLCLLAGSFLWTEPAPHAARAGAVTLPVTAAEPMTVPPFVREITGSGYVVAPAQVAVFSQQAGRITRVLVQPGDRVVEGQPLVILSDADLHFAFEQAKATLRAAELTLVQKRIEQGQAEATLRRRAALAAGQIVSRQSLEDAQATRDLAVNAVAQAEAARQSADLALRIAAGNLEDLTIRAPIPGMVTKLAARVGERVLSQVDDPEPDRSLATLTDTTSMVIDADVAEASLASLREGLTGEAALDAWPAQPFAIEIQRIAPVISPEKGTVALRLRLIDPPAGIRPAMAARIHIITKPEGPFQ
jgi:RND family efflux transporter MFP subunit